MKLLSKLNDKQKEAVKCTKGPLLVLAGAGSGKTRVLTHRIAYLIKEKNISPYNILAITFTNKAAKEMKDRVDALLDKSAEGAWISTFHSACVRMLRRDIEKIGYDRNFVIYDTQDSTTAIKKVLKSLDINEKNFKPKSMLSKFGALKNEMISPEDYLKDSTLSYYDENVGKIYKGYQERLKENNALDFDDLIYLTVRILMENDDVLEYYRNKFKYILIDEYQDTNQLQFQFAKLLAGGHRNLCVVGDDDQSIFMWRGADVGNILSFEDEYKDAKIIKLEQNYRSTQNILKAANNIIVNNDSRKDKELWTEKNEGEKIYVSKLNNEYEESKFIVSKIKELVDDKDYKYRDFAILYRMNVQSRSLEESLAANSVPYKIFGGTKFYDRKEVKDVMAYLKLIYNDQDRISLERAISLPKRGIGTKTIASLYEACEKSELNPVEVMQEASQFPEITRKTKAFKDFSDLIYKYKELAKTKKPSDLIGEIIEEIDFEEEYKRTEPEKYETRMENIKELVSIALEREKDGVETLEEFIEEVSLTSEETTNDEDETNFISLMTMHSAKGLEFPVVFVAGFEEGIFPLERSLGSDSELEEERRLCYVAVTRAMSRLYVTHTLSRTLYGKTTYNGVSRFLNEIEDTLIEYDGLHKEVSKTKRAELQKEDKLLDLYKKNVKDKSVKKKSSLKPKADKKFNYSQGDRVIHKRFGIGTVKSIVKEDDDYVVEVNFESKGIRRLMAAYARLEKM